MQIGSTYGNTAVNYNHQNRYHMRSEDNQENTMEDMEQGVGNPSTAWSADAIFASGMRSGQHFAVYKSEEYSRENPMLIVRGTDSAGKGYEQTIDPRKVDVEDCSYVEFMALNSYLVDTGAIAASDVNSFTRPTENDLETADYMNSMREWRDTQFDVGNIVGYQHAAKNVDAIKNFTKEQNGTVKYIDFGAEQIKCYEMEGRLQSGILGLTAFNFGKAAMNVNARYAAESTIGDPVIEVHLNGEDGSYSQTVKVHINEIDPKNATALELFALCSYTDAQGMSGTDGLQNSYMRLLQYVSEYGGFDGVDSLSEFAEQKQDWVGMVQAGEKEESKKLGGQNTNGSTIGELLQNFLEQFLKEVEKELDDGLGDEKGKDKSETVDTENSNIEHMNTGNTNTENGNAENINTENINTGNMSEEALEGTQKKKKGIATVRPLEDTIETQEEAVRGQSLTDHVNNKSKVPYSYLAKDGIVEYNGVVFVCDEVHSALCLGDMSNDKDVLTIPMSNGGVLKVNRDNIGDLSSAIGMFSPEDVRRILEAIAQDNKAQQMLQEIEEDKNTIGDGNTNTTNGESVRSQDEAEEDAKTDTASVLNNKSTFTNTDEIAEENARKVSDERAQEHAQEITDEMLDLLLREPAQRSATA